MYGAMRGQEEPQLLRICLDKLAACTASCHRMRWHRLPHQAGDVCELRAGALQPCATSWQDLLHNIGGLSAATTAQMVTVCLAAGGQSAQDAAWATRVEGGYSMQSRGGHRAWNHDHNLQAACRGGVAAGSPVGSFQGPAGTGAEPLVCLQPQSRIRLGPWPAPRLCCLYSPLGQIALWVTRSATCPLQCR